MLGIRLAAQEGSCWLCGRPTDEPGFGSWPSNTCQCTVASITAALAARATGEGWPAWISGYQEGMIRQRELDRAEAKATKDGDS